MKQNEWQYLDKQLSYFMIYNILPNMISYSVSLLYFSNVNCDNSYYKLYNSIKSYTNIVGEDKVLVNSIVRNILKNKYNLLILSFYPLKIKRID